MAFRTWVKLLGTVLGVSAVAGASQLGVTYGLGILRLTRVLDDAARDQWTAQLAWVAWLAMISAVIGGLAGDRLRDRLGGPVTIGTHVAVALAAGAGAAIVVPLTMQPARTAQVAGVDPVFVIGLCAAFGTLVGVFAAYAVLAHVVARWSMCVVGLAIWAIAIVSVTPSLGFGDALPAVRLGVFDAGFLSPAVTQRTALFTMPALALLVGAVHGWTARRREMPTLTIALAGLPGPALLTVSYLIAGPGSGADRYQIVPYWAAMTATGAGVLGSVLAAVIGRGDADAPDGAQAPEQRPESAPADATTSLAPAAGPPTTSPTSALATAPGGRRSSAADAFTGRTAEWPARRTEPDGRGGVALGEYAGREPEPFDAFAAGPGPRTPEPPLSQPVAEPTPYVPEPATRPLPPAAREETSAAAEKPPSAFEEPPYAAEKPSAAIEEPPYAAGRPPAAVQEPPAAVQEPRATVEEAPATAADRPARGGGLLGRIPFGRGRGRPGKGAPAHPEPPAAAPPLPDGPLLREAPAFRDAPTLPPRETPDPPTWPGRRPLVPEPHAVSPPLPQPEPISPPLSVTPVADRRDRKRRGDDEFVDWVSGLGSPHDDDR